MPPHCGGSYRSPDAGLNTGGNGELVSPIGGINDDAFPNVVFLPCFFVAQPLRLEIKKLLSSRSDRVKCVDIHPTEPWVLSALYNGHVFIWDYQVRGADDVPCCLSCWSCRRPSTRLTK